MLRRNFLRLIGTISLAFPFLSIGAPPKVELLLKAIDATHSDPVKDKKGCYKKGDIVEVREENSQYGKKECLPKFLVVNVLGTMAQWKYLMKPEINEDEMITRRRYNYDFDTHLGAAKMAEILAADWQIETIDVTKISDKGAI